jgi:H+/gluconate symporter-like permease
VARGGVKIVSVNGPLTVTFTTASGVTPAVYSDEATTAAISLPATVSDGASTTFYFKSPGSYTLSVKTASGIQIAADLNTTRPIAISAGTIATYSYDTRLVSNDASGDSGRHSPGTDLSATYVPASSLKRSALLGTERPTTRSRCKPRTTRSTAPTAAESGCQRGSATTSRH